MNTLLRYLILAILVFYTIAKVDCIACANIGNARFTEGSEYYSVKCNEGFFMEQTLVCEDDTWVYKLPECKSVQCTENPEIKHGTLNTEIKSRDVGAEYEFTCDPVFGSGIVGQIQCKATGKWEANLVCEDVPKCVEGLYGSNPFNCGEYYDCTSGSIELKICDPGEAWFQTYAFCTSPSMVPGCEDCCT